MHLPASLQNATDFEPAVRPGALVRVHHQERISDPGARARRADPWSGQFACCRQETALQYPSAVSASGA